MAKFRNTESNLGQAEHTEPPSAVAGKRIRLVRHSRGWTLQDLAERLSVSPATVSGVENGRTALTIDRLAHIAAVLGVPIGNLLPEVEASPPEALNPEIGKAVRHWREFPALALDPVLSSAVSAFVRTGYHGASMRSIAEGSGMSIAGVYHHYGSKQDLLVAILDLTMDELEWRLPAARDEAANQGGGPLEKLSCLVEALALFHTLRPDLAFIGASEMRSLEHDQRERIAARRSTIQHLIDAQVSVAVADGLASSARPREAGRAIATMCTALPQWFDNSGPTSPEQIAAEYAVLALRMVGAHKESWDKR